MTIIFLLGPMGVLAPVSAKDEIFRCMCLQNKPQKSPPTHLKSYPKFRNPWTTFENTPLCAPKYSIVHGVGGVPDFFQGVETSYFCYFGPHAKFRSPRTTFEITPLCAPKYSIVRGVKGVPEFFF